ncbi:maltokinase N-terminal cap-like domain-containing protein [Vallicoccus soli]|uniref:Maltokinase n=1 Tax=Vallicoccus soli TaxID=2339232 RepID=A0A3A3Z8F2_9ACTN|nr:phosphotransferase [Vallicoccus soli]RJK98187.1 aminoglycoside phosphotransferase [Vallicoccus soli]
MSADPAVRPSVEALTAFLPAQRWFAGKSRQWEVTGTTTVAALDERTTLDLVHVRYADGEAETYQLPLVRRDAPVEGLAHVLVEEVTGGGGTTWLYDALHDKEATGLWTGGVASGRREDGVVFHRVDGGAEVDEDATSIVIGAEQSNTSLVYGGSTIMKVFRKVSFGLNPDIEIHEALVRAGSEHVAEILGWVEGRWTDPASGEAGTGSLAMLQCFLTTATEGWESAKASVRDLYAEGDLHADEVGGDFAGEASRLGEATAQVHQALRETLGTGTLDQDALRALAQGMHERLRRALPEVPGLEEHADALAAAFDDLAALPGGLPVQRVHGDFHLGQTMRTLKGWKLLDFEGEPARPLRERQAMDSPLKDVAGMLRSFDYAARHLLVDRPEPHLEYRATEWAERNRDAFCAGYGEAAGRDPREDGAVLRAFEVDKAVYEAVYEARNRPGWLRIPLSAIERLATQGERRS